jgi:arginyl-tRNA synthetase
VEFDKYFKDEAGNELLELWLAAKTSYSVDQCIATTELAYLAKHVFELAQLFHAFYHRHRVLTNPMKAGSDFYSRPLPSCVAN